MPGTYLLKQTSDGQFMFKLKTPNGEVILTSERYTKKGSAEGGIGSVRVNSPHDERYGRRTASDGSQYFVLKALNGAVIGKSEMYSSAAKMEDGIAAVKRVGPVAEIDDQT